MCECACVWKRWGGRLRVCVSLYVNVEATRDVKIGGGRGRSKGGMCIYKTYEDSKEHSQERS